MSKNEEVGFASALRARDELLAQHVELVAKRLQGTLAAHEALTDLARRIREGDLPTIVVDEPGPEVRTVLDPHGNKVRRGRDGGWVWWGGRSGNRPEWSWEKVRAGFGPLVLPPPEDS